jgi:endonuclease III
LRALHSRMRRIVRALARQRGLTVAAMTKIAGEKHDPYEVLVGTLISLRTRDEVTEVATRRLLGLAPSVDRLETLRESVIAKAIYPACFYRTKARTLRRVAAILRTDHGGKVPDTMEQLLALPGVGRKTANLVLLLGYGQAALCVDTHVHRISNRLGLVATRAPDATEAALRERLPRSLWWHYNELLVSFGKSVCTPLSPRCSICPVGSDCPRVGVKRAR